MWPSYSTASAICRTASSLIPKQLLEGCVPRQERPARLVCLQAVEDVATHAQPRCAGKRPLHRLAPDCHGQDGARLAVPDQARRLEPAAAGGEEHGAAEEKL